MQLVGQVRRCGRATPKPFLPFFLSSLLPFFLSSFLPFSPIAHSLTPHPNVSLPLSLSLLFRWVLYTNVSTEPQPCAPVPSSLLSSLSSLSSLPAHADPFLQCFYWASNAGDGFDTVQTLEKVNAIVVTIVFNNGFFAFILASIIAGLQDFNRAWKRRAEYRIKIDAVNEVRRGHPSIPPSLHHHRTD